MPAPHLPHQIGGYPIVRELGRGGMGVVYVARHKTLGREVALKTLLGDADPTALERFRQEAQVAAQIGHPNIVPVHDFGQEGALSFVVMDLIEGESLDDRVKRTGPLAPDEAVRVVEIIAGALEEVHARGVLHRDLKPHNVLLRASDEQPLLTDFGLAKVADHRLTQTGAMLGTPAYMSPEQIDGAAIDARADVYGLGATLFHLLTGEAPFTGATAINIFSKVLSTDAPPPSSLRPGIDARLDQVCRTCLDKEPEERYASMAALQEALRAWREPTSSSLGCVAGLLALGTLALALGITAVVSSGAPPEAVEPAVPRQPEVSTVQPPPSTRHGLAWDSQRKELLLFGGFDHRTKRRGSFWRRRAGRWSEIPLRRDGTTPAPQANASIAFHAGLGKLVVFTNPPQAESATWTWDGKAWTKLALTRQPPSRQEAAMAYDAGREAVVLFGGRRYARNARGKRVNRYLNDTWTWNSEGWKERTVDDPPAKRRQHAMAYDPIRARVVLFGGYHLQAAFGDTWTWDGEAWSDHAVLGPSPRMVAQQMAWDPRRKGVVLVGGKDRAHTGRGERYTQAQVEAMIRSDMWLWDGEAWTEITPTPRPPPTYLGALAFDPPADLLVLFGGEGYGPNVQRDRHALDTLWED